LSYSTKTLVAKSCFRFSSVKDVDFPVIEAAVDKDECAAAMSKPAEEQDVIKAKLTTTTTVTTTTTTTTEEQIAEEEDLDVEAGFDAMEIIIEAKALFTSGEENIWEYNGKEIKCCTSSSDSPTKLQDMTLKELPKARVFGSPTGCGAMFGDTYHNGPKRHDKCPVLASVLKEITGEEFETIESSLEISDSSSDLSSSFVEESD
jgi:hypothetical protein